MDSRSATQESQAGQHDGFQNLKAKEDTVYALKKKEITPIIEEIFNGSNQVFGARKINAVLRLRGYTVAEKTVASIMHENGWFSVRGGAKRIYKMTKQRRENILSQQFVATAPNEVWVSDITFFTCKEVKYYICVIIDLFARKVVACTISKNNGTRLTKSTLTKAVEERHPSEGLIFHSDRGTNYTARTFIDCCKAFGMTQSLSRKNTPYDNSVMEAFFKTLKAEELYRNNYRSEREFRARVGVYIEFYNSRTVVVQIWGVIHFGGATRNFGLPQQTECCVPAFGVRLLSGRASESQTVTFKHVRAASAPSRAMWGGFSKTKSTSYEVLFVLEAPPGIGPGMKVLQTSALPLGYGAVYSFF